MKCDQFKMTPNNASQTVSVCNILYALANKRSRRPSRTLLRSLKPSAVTIPAGSPSISYALCAFDGLVHRRLPLSLASARDGPAISCAMGVPNLFGQGPRPAAL